MVQTFYKERGEFKFLKFHHKYMHTLTSKTISLKFEILIVIFNLK